MYDTKLFAAQPAILFTVKFPGPLKVAIVSVPQVVKVLQAPLTDAHINCSPAKVDSSSCVATHP